MSQLTQAITEGDLSAVRALVAAEPALLESSDNGVTPLLLAIYHGRLEVAELLLSLGAPESFAEACALGHLERVKTQLTESPDLLNARTSDGFPALGVAVFFRHPDVARHLIEAGANVNEAASNSARVAPVHAAAAVCDRDTMRLLLARGADPNARQQMEYTALHGAASRGDIEMAEILLAGGADRNATGSDGMTPADIALKYGKPEFAEWIARS